MMIAPTHSQASSRPRQRGLSIIELLISMGIGLLLVATVGFAYVSARQSFRTQDANSRSQESARFAFEIMGNDIHMAGFTGGPQLIAAPATAPTNTIAGFNAATDTSIFNLFNTPLWGFEQGTDFTGCAVSACRTANTDAVMVIHADNERAMPMLSFANPTITLDAWPAANAPAANNLMVASDYTHSAAFQVSGINSGANQVTANGALGAFGAVASGSLYPMRGAVYYIGQNASTGEPGLYRQEITAAGATTTTELIEGISNMQITYGVDSTAAPRDGTIDADGWTATQVTAGSGTGPGGGAVNLPNEAVAGVQTAAMGYWKRVDRVTVTLTTTARAGSARGVAGGNYTKTFTTTFAIRNRRP